MRWLVILLFVAGCVSNGTSDVSSSDGDSTATVDTQPDNPEVTSDAEQLVNCTDHSGCKSDEYCDLAGHCRTRKGAGERCDGVVLSGSDINAACLENACYRDPFKTAFYCASSSDGCSVNGQTVAKDLVVCDESAAGYKTCVGSGVWSDSTTCQTSVACYAFVPDKDLKFTGMTSVQLCKNGEGCTPKSPVCEACLAYFTVDSETNKCRTDCRDKQGNDDDSLCWSLAKCVSGVCLPTALKLSGVTCLDNAECQDKHCSLTLSADGTLSSAKVCCETACDQPCQGCNGEGKCVNLALKPDGSGQSDARCAAEEKSTCGKSGLCDGAGQCTKWDNTTICTARHCDTNTGQSVAYLPAFCDGQGACDTIVGTSCVDGCDADNPTQCKGTVACDSHSDCVVGQYCAKGGKCLNKLKNYESCSDVVGNGADNKPLSSGNACESGQCTADGVGVDAGSVCTPVDSCVFSGKVYAKDAIRCNGNDNEIICAGAEGWKSHTICDLKLCSVTDGVGYVAKQCADGVGCSGSCQPCVGFVNATLEGCPNSCKVDADCYGTHYCKGGTCMDRLAAGAICEKDGEKAGCQSGLFCVPSATDGEKVCCGKDCAECEYCTLTVDPETDEASWVCNTRNAGFVDAQCKVPGSPTPHADCSTYACTGKPGEGCQFPVGKPCGAQFACSNGVKSTYTCQADGTCKSSKENCPTAACLDSKSCKPACNTHADCLTIDEAKCKDGANNKCYCDNTDGFCLTRLSAGKRCDQRSKPKFPASDDAVCASTLKCKEDTLSYTTGTTNELAGFFCAKADQCVDASSSSAQTATVVGTGYVHCEPAGSDGTQYWTCSDSGGNSTWVKVSQKCQTQLYPGCDTALGVNTGYMQNVCTSGTGSSKGCSQTACTSCEGKRRPTDNTYGCMSNCHTCTILNCYIIYPISGKPGTSMTTAPGDVIIVPPLCCNRYDSSKCLNGYTCKSGDICSTP